MTHPTKVYDAQTTGDINYGLQGKQDQQKHLEILPSIFPALHVQVHPIYRVTHHHHHYHRVLHDG
jgi:hypothetical protein